MSGLTTKESLMAFGYEEVLKMFTKDPQKNLPKILNWVDRLDSNGMYKDKVQVFRKVLSDPENNWYKFIMGLWETLDDDVRNTFFRNFIINSAMIGLRRQEQTKAEHDCNVPWAILMDPTSACNLNCTGCWAAEYGNQLNMTFEELDSIIEQGKKMGTYMYIYSGGEPLVRKDDIIKLCEKHSDAMFLAFTNGTLIDEKFADEMLRVKNFMPAISIEGFEEETDSRRGEGTFNKVVKAMEILQERRLGYGASLCYTSKNTEVIASDEYMDFLVDKGCKFAWYFTYMPVGVGAPTDLLAESHQRELMYHKIREWRETKPIFTMDFWNDGEYAHGCIAGGRNYLHINANGDIEPCAFIHYSDSNIREKSLLDAYKSPLFMEYRANQPFNDNMLRPCPLLDNYGKLAKMVDKSGAHSTDLTEQENVHDLCAKCKDVSDKWAVVADKLWKKSEESETQKNEEGKAV